MERPRIFLDTKTTNSTVYVDLLSIEVSRDARGISRLSVSIDPDPNALYNIIIGSILNMNDLEITAIWGVELPHLTEGVYKGINAGDAIRIQHKTKDGLVTVKTGIALTLNEVVVA